jgi:uncharacterized membrane protein
MGKFKIIAFALIAASFLVSLLAYPYLPERMVTHWNAAGIPDGFSSRNLGTFLVPVLGIGILLLFQLLPFLDPYHKNYKKFAVEYEGFQAAFSFFFLALHSATIGYSLGWAVSIPFVTVSTMGALFIAMGIILPRVRRNFFFGIRTPWAISSEANWKRTHEFGGKVFIFLGIFSIASAAFGTNFLLFLGVMIVSILSISAYSWWLFHKKTK